MISSDVALVRTRRSESAPEGAITENTRRLPDGPIPNEIVYDVPCGGRDQQLDDPTEWRALDSDTMEPFAETSMADQIPKETVGA